MKQYKITSADLQLDNDTTNDCYLDPNDPVHELKITSYLGGLGSSARLEEYRLKKHFDQYPVYPEDDGTDRPRNPYSPV
jgi:hypothetical protein